MMKEQLFVAIVGGATGGVIAAAAMELFRLAIRIAFVRPYQRSRRRRMNSGLLD